MRRRGCTLVGLLCTIACGSEAEVQEAPPPVVPAVAAEDIRLLPFSVRLSKLERVVGRDETDPVFETVLAQRVVLGDHDYARSLRPDRRWSARKMGVWVKSLLPVCESEAFASRYPDVVDAPDDLFEAAYGRAPTDLDREVLAGTGDPRLACLTVLSSLEFVSQ